MNDKLLVIPDVHGRPFWRDAVTLHDYSQIIFLGDYLDPYAGRENISAEEGYANFQDIMEWACGQTHAPVLLLGNHDLHYWRTPYGSTTAGGRYNYQFASNFRHFFEQYADRFCMAHEVEIAGKRFLFTHAGVNGDWLQRHSDVITELTAEKLNTIFPEHLEILNEASWTRGGIHETGSMIWSDVRDMEKSPVDDDKLYQIFGHSQQPDGPVITPHWACLDCRQAFIIDDKGEIRPVTPPPHK